MCPTIALGVRPKSGCSGKAPWSSGKVFASHADRFARGHRIGPRHMHFFFKFSGAVFFCLFVCFFVVVFFLGGWEGGGRLGPNHLFTGISSDTYFNSSLA